MKSSPRSLQLEKACAQPRRPNAAKKERERERERETDRERRKEGRKETKKGKKEERKKKKEREIPVFPGLNKTWNEFLYNEITLNVDNVFMT